VIQSLAAQVMADTSITVYSCTEVIHSEGYVGNFKITLSRRPPQSRLNLDKVERLSTGREGSAEFIPFVGVYPQVIPAKSVEVTIETGAIVFATGFKTYTPRQGEYGFGVYPEVITLPELIRIMAQNRLRTDCLEIDGRKIERVALIHCVGSRQIPGIHEADSDDHLNEYCLPDLLQRDLAGCR